MRAPWAGVALAAALCASCAPAAPAPKSAPRIQVRGDRTVIALRYEPHAPADSGELAVCNPGLVLVPVGGGLFAAGLGGWLVRPGVLAITAAGCDDQARVYVMLAGHRLARFPDGVAGGHIELLATLPSGSFQLLTTGDGAAWMWGRDAERQRWHLFRWAGALTEVWSGERRVRAVAPVGPSVAVLVVGGDVLLLRANGESSRLTQLRAIDGATVDRDGALYLSVRDGILRLARGAEHLEAEWVARGIHGPLRMGAGALYVLWREEDRVVRLAPRAP